MLIPVAIGAVVLLAIASSSKPKVEPKSTAEVAPAEVTELTVEEYETFNAGMGQPPLEASALLALLPGETLDADELASKLGELGYTQLGVVVIDREDFDPNRARLRIERDDMRFDEFFEDDSLEDFLKEVDERVLALREADNKASAGHRVNLGPGEHPADGRGLIGGDNMRLGPGEHPADGRGLIGANPLAQVPAHKRAQARRHMRSALKRGVTRNPKVAAKLAARKVK